MVGPKVNGCIIIVPLAPCTFWNREKCYFVSKIVQTYCEKNCFIDLEKLLQIRAWGTGICKNNEITIKGMLQTGGQGGRTPTHILADQKAPPGSGCAPHYYLPLQIFRLCNMPAIYLEKITWAVKGQTYFWNRIHIYHINPYWRFVKSNWFEQLKCQFKQIIGI